MSHVIARGFEAQERAIAVGDFAAVARDYGVPAPIFIGGRVLRAETAAEMLTLINVFYKMIADQGVASRRKRVISITPLTNSAFLCVVECKYLDDKGAFLGSGMVRHWCRALDSGMRIELTEFLSMPYGLDAGDIEHMASKVRQETVPDLAATNS